MKVRLLILVLWVVTSLQACQKNDDNDQNNSNIPNVAFDTGGLINTNLPQFNQLQFPGNFVLLNNNYGINGVVLYYAGGTNYSAFELTDPAHQLNTCSNLTVEGTTATCNCTDANKYNIIVGTAIEGTSSQFPLKRYFVEANGNIIRVFNN
jgi:hypothetical protein